jgi:hypothetical protein
MLLVFVIQQPLLTPEFFVLYRFDGWVVCEENVDVLVAAWEEEQAILKQKEHEVVLVFSYLSECSKFIAYIRYCKLHFFHVPYLLCDSLLSTFVKRF